MVEMRNELFGLALVAATFFLLRTQHSFFSADEFDAYLINMKKRPERLENFSDNYVTSDLGSKKPFKRIEAVDGSKIDISDLTNPRMTRGMIGCYKSHYRVFQELYESGKPYGLVFEDDAEMDRKIYQKTVDRLDFPENWDIILLGHVRLMDYEKGPRPGLLRVRDFWGTQGYLISRRGVSKMLLYKDIPISLQIDGFMSKLAREGKLDMYAIDPPMVKQGNFGTDIQV